MFVGLISSSQTASISTISTRFVSAVRSSSLTGCHRRAWTNPADTLASYSLGFALFRPAAGSSINRNRSCIESLGPSKCGHGRLTLIRFSRKRITTLYC